MHTAPLAAIRGAASSNNAHQCPVSELRPRAYADAQPAARPAGFGPCAAAHVGCMQASSLHTAQLAAMREAASSLRFLRLLSSWSVWAVVVGVPLSLLLLAGWLSCSVPWVGRGGLSPLWFWCVGGVVVVAPLLWCRCLLRGFGPKPPRAEKKSNSIAHLAHQYPGSELRSRAYADAQ